MPASPLTALVTGANRGIGFEVSRQLARLGYRVILTSRDLTQGERALSRLSGEGELYFHPLDVTNDLSVLALRDWAFERFAKVDVLVNNAGVFLDRGHRILDLPLAVLQQTLETNTLGALRTSQAFLPAMLATNFGRVVNVSSGMGQTDSMADYGPAYRLSKLTLNGLTQILADAARGHNVLVNAVCPGWVKTDMGGPNAGRELGKGAASVVWAATLPDGGPTGGFFRDGQPLQF